MIETRRRGGVEDRLATPATYELATWSVRAWAYLIDLLVLFGLSMLAALGAVIAEGDSEDARRLAETLGLAVVLPLWLAYAPLMLMRGGARNGQTLGKQALKIRVVRESGEPMTLGNGLLREVIGRQLLVPFTYGLYAVVDYAWPWWDKPRQCLHDKVGGTRVVRAAPVELQREDAMTHDAFAAPAADPADWRTPWAEPAEPAAQPDQPPTSGGRSTVPPPPSAPEPGSDAPVRGGWLPPSAGR